MIPEEQSPGTVVANITAKDPDDEDSPSRLFYSIQSSDPYFSINPCKTNKNISSNTPPTTQQTMILHEFLGRFLGSNSSVS